MRSLRKLATQPHASLLFAVGLAVLGSGLSSGLGPTIASAQRTSAGATASRGATVIRRAARTERRDSALATAQARIRALRSSLRGARLSQSRDVNNGAYASVRQARIVGTRQSVVVRHPEEVAQAVRLHNTMVQLAHEIGLDELVAPAAEAPLPQGEPNPRGARTAMFSAHVGTRFVAANQAPDEWLDRVPEAQRVAGALLDFLTDQQDRIPKNLMLDEQGSIRLIDHDFSLGHDNPFAQHVPMFFPGERLGFRSPQRTFRDLPENMRAMVTSIATSTPDALAERYGLEASEAHVLVTRAQYVTRYGLRGAAMRLPRIRANADRDLRRAPIAPPQAFTNDATQLAPDLARAAARDLRRVFFGRVSADAASIAREADQIAQGRLAHVISAHLATPEFTAERNARTAEELITRMYKTLYGRTPSPGGWHRTLDLARRGWLGWRAFEIVQTDEYARHVGARR